MKNNLKINLTTLTNLSIILWILSLALNGLTLGYNGSEELRGLEILVMGWLSPLAFNFAWYANVFYIYAIINLRSNEIVTLSPMIAIILCFDMFRLNEYMINEAGHTTIVYGYGWGAILWLLSIFLLLIAAGARLKNEGKQTEDYSVGVMMQRVGSAILLITVLLTGYFAIHDRLIANTTESNNISGIAFKRIKVCSVSETPVIEPIKNFSGTLIIQLNRDPKTRQHPSRAGYPFEQRSELIEWGITNVIIRSGGITPKEYGVVTPLDLKVSSGAVLYVYENYSKSINIILVEDNTNRIVFNHTWQREPYPVNKNHYCPDYKSFPQKNEQPRKMLMQALGLSN